MDSDANNLSSRITDISGQRFGRLTVLGFVGLNKYRNAMWECKCDCGSIVISRGYRLVHNESKSCGCHKIELSRIRSTKHGMKGTRIYRIWSGMLSRCNNPKTKNYIQYGARGITVCSRWNNFQNFLDDMGVPPEKHQIDRINGNKGYSPDNCRWVSSMQNNHNRRDNRILVCDGESLPLAEWERRMGMKRGLLNARIVKYKWDTQKAIKTPARKLKTNGQ